MAKRNSDSNSVAGAQKAMQNALAGVFAPPPEVDLPDEALPFWRAIVRARARDEWNDNELQVAAQLARTREKIERLEKVLDHQGEILVNERGTPIKNPLFSVLEDLTRRQMALMRSLQVNATASAGQAKDNQRKRKAEKDADSVASSLDDLLAK